MQPIITTNFSKTKYYPKNSTHKNKYTLNITLNTDKDYFLDEGSIETMFGKLQETAKTMFIPKSERYAEQEKSI